jgi:recombination associated protein RdgC
MWFRNLRLYRLQRDFSLDLAQLDELLAKKPLTRCGDFEMVSRGWVFPRQDGAFVHAVNRQWLLALGIEQKLLPAAVIRQTAQERAAAIEAEDGRKVGRKEMRDIADRVSEELMPRAFTRRSTTWGWLDPVNGWLVIDAGSDARADDFVEALITSVEEIAPRLLKTKTSPIAAMTDWLIGGEAPASFSIDSDCELRTAAEAKSAIRYVHHGLSGPEISEHIAAGKVAAKLGMTWSDRISFVLDDKLHIKRLAFLDVLKEQAEQSGASADEQFDGDFALMTGELVKMLQDLTAALGGEMKEG